ncbi:MAG: GTPase ObgE [Sumerlaeia bacterium]
MSGRSQFVDSIRLHVKAGDGGHGCIAFLRQKGQPHGGPAGGDGGKGGDIIFEADPELGTLIDLRYRHSIRAQRGAHGGGKNMTGRGGKDELVKVPLGTVVIDDATGEELADFTKPGQRAVIARGGDGGLGNAHFVTASNQAPRKATDGREGDEFNLILELKIIADCGFVGLPNAGKSTLLGALTDANPRIAPYPFTTLSPNLGVFIGANYSRRVTLADIPGLIEGAHTGQGLGHRFLRHIERTRVLVHIVAPESGADDAGELTLADPDPEALIYAFDLVRDELEAYSDQLLRKPVLTCLNKIDLLSEDETAAILRAFQKERGIDLIPICAKDPNHLEHLRTRLEAAVEEATAPGELDRDDDEDSPATGHFDYREEPQ